MAAKRMRNAWVLWAIGLAIIAVTVAAAASTRDTGALVLAIRGCALMGYPIGILGHPVIGICAATDTVLREAICQGASPGVHKRPGTHHAAPNSGGGSSAQRERVLAAI